LLRTLEGHGSSVETVAFHPRGETLASGSSDKTVRLWDIATGVNVRTFEVGEEVRSLSFNADGQSLACGTENGVVLVNTQTGIEGGAPVARESDVRSVSFSPDGRLLAFGRGDGAVRLWDVASGAGPRTLGEHERSVETVAFSKDGGVVASGGWGNVVKLWDVSKGELLRTLEAEPDAASLNPQPDAVKSVAFAPGRRVLASAGLDRVIRFWNMTTGRLLRRSERQEYNLSSVSFSPDGQTLASGSQDEAVKLWSVKTGKVTRAFEGHYFTPSTIVFNPKDKNVMAVGSGKATSVKLWNLAGDELLHALDGDDVWGQALAFSPDGAKLASAGGLSDEIYLWGVQTGRLLRRLKGHSREVKLLSFSPDGAVLASGSDDGTIKLWSVAAGRLLRTLKGKDLTISTVAFNSDGTVLASGSEDEKVKLWSVRTGKVIHELSTRGSSIDVLRFSPDGMLLAGGSDDCVVMIWDFKTRRELRRLTSRCGHVTSLSFSPDGKLLAVGSEEAPFKLWDVETGRESGSYDPLYARAPEVAFSPDGGHLVSAGSNGGLTFWALQAKQPLAGLYFFGDKDWVAVAPDGLFDGKADAMQQVSWRVGSANEVISLDSFYNDFYHPGLIAEIMGGGSPRASIDIASTLQLPGLRAMFAQGLARLDSREGATVLCFPERPTAAPQIFADAQPLAFSIEDLTFDEEDPACPWRRALPAGRQYELSSVSGGKGADLPRLTYEGKKSDTANSVLHVQAIGVSDYDLNSSGLKPLPASAAGAKEVEGYFLRQQQNVGKPYRRIRVWEGLYDKGATRDRIRQRFAEMAKVVRAEDVVFLFLSGHGLVPAGQ
ncbi:MAG TPA: WD40 repeat domain-containing protein, partial [Pyrinomonadaceae bacterium]|nr:WD40 repeat domain-containing protein [Pyrinomonadaceae bacterium]